MLKLKLFRAFAALTLVIGILAAVIGLTVIKSRVIDEAQRRVRLDLSSAWSVYDSHLENIETTVRLAANKKIFSSYLETPSQERADEALGRLQLIQQNFNVDFLTVVDSSGKAVLRASPPFNTGDLRLSDPAVARALTGDTVSGTELMSRGELVIEAEDIAERAFLVLEDTPRARPTPRTEESRGMVMITAAPIMDAGKVVGAIYGGVLLNRNDSIVDHLRNVIYGDENYEGNPMGTATIFLRDSRIATTVRRRNGNRAIGTRVSKEVAERVLDNGMPWIDRAFVVKDWYLTAYEPIKDVKGEVIGMLYVGILEKPFKALGQQVMVRYAILLAFGLAAALIYAFLIAGRLAMPIHELATATATMEKGERHSPVACNSACRETESLVLSFNKMASVLEEREARLKEANSSLMAMNRSYMDMLGFVSHELKSPISSIMNYVYLLDQQKLGGLTDKQANAIRNIDANTKRIVEMVRHYLNLSRIENGELQPVTTDVTVMEEVIQPLLDALEAEVDNKKMRVENDIPADLHLDSDINMTREAFENLIGNAVKYGCEGGLIRLSCENENGSTWFKIGNEGDGIPPENIETVFNKFARIENGQASKRQKGTGLGLFITKTIVEAHGGKIEVESTPGEWTEFRFSLPRHETAEEKA